MTEEEIKTTGFTSENKSFVDSIQQASMQLDTIKSSFNQGMEDLGKIQTMLDLDGVSKMTTVINTYEMHIAEVERAKAEAQEGARRFSMELEKEKERLVKLWEAYKGQEDELATQERRVGDLEANLHQSEVDRRDFENDANVRIETLTSKLNEKDQKIQEYEAYKGKAEYYESKHEEYEQAVDNLQSECGQKDGQIHKLEGQVKNLKQYEDYAQYKAKYEDIYNEYTREKERLAKLFKLYEETESENKQLKEQVRNWQSWFDTNEEYFGKLFNSVEQLKNNTNPAQLKKTPSRSTPTKPTSAPLGEYPLKPETELMRDTPKPSGGNKKKLRLRK